MNEGLRDYFANGFMSSRISTLREKLSAFRKETLNKSLHNNPSYDIKTYKAANTIKFWYTKIPDENKALETICGKENSILVKSILSRRS